MRVVIIGLSSSGKTTFAAEIASILSIPCLHLDDIVFNFYGNKKRTRVASEIYIPRIKKFSSKKNWIIEGMFPFTFLFEKADIIIWMHPSLTRILLQQWKRYLTDPDQRRRFGFISNVKLSRFSIDIRLNRMGITFEDNKPRITLRELEEMLTKQFRRKVIIITDPQQKKTALRKIITAQRKSQKAR